MKQSFAGNSMVTFISESIYLQYREKNERYQPFKKKEKRRNEQSMRRVPGEGDGGGVITWPARRVSGDCRPELYALSFSSIIFYFEGRVRPAGRAWGVGPGAWR